MASGDRPNTSREDTGSSKSPSSPSKKDQAKTSNSGSSKKLSQKEQSERFREAARKLDVDESGKAFDRALEALIPRSKP
jgi:hypothetical protein